MFKLPSVRTGIVYGIALTLFASAAVADTVQCSLTTACEVYENTGTGVAFHAETTSGQSLRANSASNNAVYAGTVSGSTVAAIDAENTGTPQNGASSVAGGFALSAAIANMPLPTLGVVSLGGTGGVEGQTQAPGTSTSRGFGVAGIDQTTGVHDFNFGVIGSSYGDGIGVLASAGGASPSFSAYGNVPVGVYALADSPSNDKNSAVALFAESDTMAIDSHNTTATSFFYANTSTDLIQGGTSKGSFSVDNSGNAVFSGTVTTPHSTILVTRGADGATRAAYGARTSAPDFEDIGQASLVNGRGYVRIDAAFRSSIDLRSAYLVFLTPEGDCNGLYVTRKSPDGFEIRELRGGRSSLAVDYRIAAKPLGEDAPRLAAIAPLRAPVERFVRTANPRPVIVSAIDQMKANLSPAAYAKVVRDAKARLSGH